MDRLSAALPAHKSAFFSASVPLSTRAVAPPRRAASPSTLPPISNIFFLRPRAPPPPPPSQEPPSTGKVPAPGRYGGAPLDKRIRQSWGGKEEDPLESGEYIWNTEWKKTVTVDDADKNKAAAEDPIASAVSSNDPGTSDGGFLSLGRSLALDSMDVDLSAELNRPSKATLEKQVEAARRAAGMQAQQASSEGKIKWRYAPTTKEERQWAEANRKSAKMVMAFVEKEEPLTPQQIAERERQQYEKLKQSLVLTTLGLGVVFTGTAAVLYSPEVAVSYAVGAVGSLVYVRMLSSSVEALGANSVQGAKEDEAFVAGSSTLQCMTASSFIFSSATKRQYLCLLVWRSSICLLPYLPSLASIFPFFSSPLLSFSLPLSPPPSLLHTPLLAPLSSPLLLAPPLSSSLLLAPPLSSSLLLSPRSSSLLAPLRTSTWILVPQYGAVPLELIPRLVEFFAAGPSAAPPTSSTISTFPVDSAFPAYPAHPSRSAYSAHPSHSAHSAHPSPPAHSAPFAGDTGRGAARRITALIARPRDGGRRWYGGDASGRGRDAGEEEEVVVSGELGGHAGGGGEAGGDDEEERREADVEAVREEDDASMDLSWHPSGLPSASLPSLSPSEAAQLLTKGRARDIRILNVAGRCQWAEHLVLASAHSTRHARGLAAGLAYELKQRYVRQGMAARAPEVEGKEAEHWMLLDCGRTVVHVMTEEGRRRYKVEALWEGKGEGGERGEGGEEKTDADADARAL
ncbi:unnamed protein product [Closterium sp. Naga37s-1]|nr:unnamed protein product [Closterium sp. Naga37s-1]